MARLLRNVVQRNRILSNNQLAAIVQDFYGYALDEENKLWLGLGRIPEEVRARRAEHFGNVAFIAGPCCASTNSPDSLTRRAEASSRWP